MSKRVELPSGPLAPPDPSPASPAPPGKFYQYPPVDLVDPNTGRIKEGASAGVPLDNPDELVSPNELAAMKIANVRANVQLASRRKSFTSGMRAAVRAAVNAETDRLNPTPSVSSEVDNLIQQVPDEVLHRLVPSPSVSITMEDAIRNLPLGSSPPQPLSGPAVASTFAQVERDLQPGHAESYNRVDSSPSISCADTPPPPPHVLDWADDVPLQPPDPNRTPSYPPDYLTAPPVTLRLSPLDVSAIGGEIHINWDDDGEVSRYPVHSAHMALLFKQKLLQIFTTRKDSIDKAVLDKSLDDAADIRLSAEQSMLQGAEGYSQYVPYGEFTVLNDSRIGISGELVSDIQTIIAGVLSGGPMSPADLENGDWPAILNKDSWFKLVASTLAAIARAAGRFKDLPSRGNFAIDTDVDELTLHDGLAVPGSQTELIKRLLEQLYARFDETGDDAALEERAKSFQEQYWARYEWLLCTRIGFKLIFLSEYINDEDFKTVIEQIVHQAPMEEVTDTIRKGWADERVRRSASERARIENDAYHREMRLAQERGEALAQQQLQQANLATDILNLRDAYEAAMSRERTRIQFEEKGTIDSLTKESSARIQGKKDELTRLYDQQLQRAEEDYKSEFIARSAGRKQFFNELDQKDHIAFIKQQASALGLVEYDELQEPLPKRTRPAHVHDRTGRSSSVVSVRKRARSTERPSHYAPTPVPPSPIPSVVHPAMEDDITPKGSLTHSPALEIPPPTRLALVVESMYAGAPSIASTQEEVAPPLAPEGSLPPTGTRDVADAHIPFPRAPSRTASPAMLVDQASPVVPVVIPAASAVEHSSASDPVASAVEAYCAPRFNEVTDTLRLIMLKLQALEAPKSDPVSKAPPHPIPPQAAAPPMDVTTDSTSAPIPAEVTQPRLSQKALARMTRNAAIPGSVDYAASRRVPPDPTAVPSQVGPTSKVGVSRPLFSAMIKQKADNVTFQSVPSRKWSPPSRALNTTVRPGASHTTEITISRNGGSLDHEEEAHFRAIPTPAIVITAQAALNKLSINPFRIIRGWWSTTHTITGNFVFTLQGVIPAETIRGLEPSLTASFPGDTNIAIPADGWMFAHVRNVPTVDPRGDIWSDNELYEAVVENDAFSNACFPSHPRWLQPWFIVERVPRSTVVFAYIDPSHALTKLLTSKEFYMFGECVQFAPIGSKAVQVQCKRCWALGHTVRTCERSDPWCFTCGGDHDGDQHFFFCEKGKNHKIPGQCDCPIACTLCSKKGHNARSVICEAKAAVLFDKTFWSKIANGTIDRQTGPTIARPATPPAPKRAASKAVKPPLSPTTIARCKAIREAITSPCKNGVTFPNGGMVKNNLQCLCCSGPKVLGWKVLFQDPSDARFAELVGVDPDLADDIINRTQQETDSDSPHSIFSTFSRIRARIVGNDTTRFTCEGRLWLDERPSVEDSLDDQVEEMFDETNDFFKHNHHILSDEYLSSLPPDLAGFLQARGAGNFDFEGLCPSPNPQEVALLEDYTTPTDFPWVDDEGADAWGLDVPISNPSNSGPKA